MQLPQSVTHARCWSLLSHRSLVFESHADAANRELHVSQVFPWHVHHDLPIEEVRPLTFPALNSSWTYQANRRFCRVRCALQVFEPQRSEVGLPWQGQALLAQSSSAKVPTEEAPRHFLEHPPSEKTQQLVATPRRALLEAMLTCLAASSFSRQTAAQPLPPSSSGSQR